MSETHCRHFSGYKPCGKHSVCQRGSCPYFESVGSRILLIHLGALGAVLRSTSLLKAIRRKYPKAHITWVTESPADQLLKGIADIDRLLTLSPHDQLVLRALEFDVALIVDKSLAASGVLSLTKAREVFGFRSNEAGVIVPANAEAQELWQIGLSNQKKFFENQKTEQNLVHESLAIGEFHRDEYQCQFSVQEMVEVARRRETWSPSGQPIIGLNTGCSAHLPFKKLSIEGHRTLIQELLKDPRFRGFPIVLLGGREDYERNRAIAHGLPVIESPVTQGLRDGFLSVAATDLVISGDSLGLHMAIALKKWSVAWFGPSCYQEIDLYGRGAKILTKASCSPCWKRHCDKPLMCYDQVDYAEIINALARGIRRVLEWSDGPPVLSDRISR